MVNKNKVIFIFLFCLLWEGLVQFQVYPTALMPSLIDIFKAFSHHKIDLLSGTVFSLWMIGKGLIISTLLMIVLVYLSAHFKLWRDWVDLWKKVIHPIPGIALLPLVVLWFGISQTSIIIIMIHAALWPMLMNVQMDYLKVKREYEQIIKSYQLPLIKQILKIYLPGCLPGLLTGLRIGWHRSWRAFISAEMIYSIMGGRFGLGWFIFERRVYMDTAGLIAGLIIVSTCSILIESFVFDAVERRTIWKWAI